jgi:hypothetical protein
MEKVTIYSDDMENVLSNEYAYSIAFEYFVLIDDTTKEK